jgi:hypothetical protein
LAPSLTVHSTQADGLPDPTLRRPHTWGVAGRATRSTKIQQRSCASRDTAALFPAASSMSTHSALLERAPLRCTAPPGSPVCFAACSPRCPLSPLYSHGGADSWPHLFCRLACSVFGKGQGAAAGAGSLKNIAAANSDQQFLHFGENRCIAKSNLTLPEGNPTALWAQGGHIPGYDGYIPGHDEEFDKPFGTSTVAAKLQQSKQQATYAGSVGSIPQSEIHSSRGGATSDLGGRAKLPVPSPPAAPAPAVPGYRGYVSGRQCAASPPSLPPSLPPQLAQYWAVVSDG